MLDQMPRRVIAVLTPMVLVIGACGGGDSGSAVAEIDSGVVIDPEQVAAARERIESDDELQAATAAPATDVGAQDDTPTPTSQPADTTLPVAEADEDELDSLLNALTVFNQCLDADGFEFIGAPGIAEGTADQFDEPYLQSLGKCATASNVLDALQGYGSAMENRTPEEIAAFNFGLPVFRDCMIALGWTVGELVPDEKGALGFGTELTPPPGSDGFGTDDVSSCRLEAEQYVADNYDPEA